MNLYNQFNNDINILIKVTQALHKSFNLQEICKVALDSVTELDNVDIAMIYLVDEEKREAVLEAHKNLPEDYIKKAGRIPYPKGVTWKAINSGKIFNIEDIQKDPDLGHAGRDLGHHSVLGIPIFLEEKIIGLIWFLSYKEHKFDEKEINLLSALGDQIAIAIAKAKMFEEMKQRQEALRESEVRYKSLFDNVPTGVYRTTPDGRIVMANAALVRMLGYSSFEELASRNLEREGFDINYPRSQFKKLLDQEGEISGLESAWVKRDGSVVFVLESTRAAREEDGTVFYYEGTVEDITNRKHAEEMLRESEKQLRLLTDALPVCISYIDAEQRYRFNNKTYEKWFGHPRGGIRGKHVKEILGEIAYSELQDKIETALSGIPITFDSLIHYKDAGTRHVNVTYVPDIGNQGRVKGFYTLISDITGRKQTEEALSESYAQLSKKNRYEMIISSVTQSVHQSINLQDVLENAVQAMSKNIDRADIVGIYLIEGEEAVLRAHKGLTDRYIERAGRIPYPKGLTWKTILEGNPIYCADAENDTFIGPAGRELGIKSYLSMPIRFEDKTVGSTGINSFETNAFNEEELKLLEIVVKQIETAINNAKQVKALRKSEEELRKARDELELRVQERTAELTSANKALRENEEKFRNLVEQTNDWIWEVDKNGIFTYSSPKVQDIIGYEPKELLGTRVFEYIHPDDCPDAMAEFERAIRTQTSGRAVFRFRHQNKGWRWLESTGKPFRNTNGQINGVIASRDITERKHAEEQIKETLKEKEVLLKEIHHRVKNNLQVISSLINLQSQYIKSKKAIEMFNETQNRIRSMALIHEQLYQSRNLAMISFKEYVQNLLSNLLYSYEIDQNAIQLSINIEDVSMAIDTAIPCGLIINELVSNSLKYAFPRGRKGKILIGLQSKNGNGDPISSRISSEARLSHRTISGEAGDEVSVEALGHSHFTLIVSDNGVGFPKDLDFRNTESLGLQLVVELAEQLRGSIELDRKGGTSFKIKFEEL